MPNSSRRVRNPLYKSPEIALINAGKCSRQIGDMRSAARIIFRRALTIARRHAPLRYNLALLTYRGVALDEARTWMRAFMQQPNPPPDALYLGMCIERKLGDRARRRRTCQQLQNRFPGSRKRRPFRRALRVSQPDRGSSAETRGAPRRCGPGGMLRHAREPPGCRSTRCRSS